MKPGESFYKDTPCPGCSRRLVRHGKRLCAGCESRLRRGFTWEGLKRVPFSNDNRPASIRIAEATTSKDLEDNIQDYFRRGAGRRGTQPVSLINLADKFDCGPSKIKAAISNLQTRGTMINIVDGVVDLENSLPETHAEERINISKFKGRQVRIGLTADNHLCSKYYRGDVLNALFDIWKEQGITEVYQCGNMIDGEASFNRHELCVPPGIESQIDFFIKNWPHRDGITTRFICGDDHEGWYTKNYGANVGMAIIHAAKLAGRSDLEYLGYLEHDVIFEAKNGSCKMRIIHAGGGTAYALSYTSQKLVESLQGGEKPAVILIGHYHKAEYCYPREVHCVQAGCTMDQSPFMRKKRLQAMVGGWTISFTIDDNGVVHDFMPQFHAFYDRQFYRNWEYIWK